MNLNNNEKLICFSIYVKNLLDYGHCRIPFEREELYYVVAESLLQMHIDYEVDRGMTFIEIIIKN